MLMGRISLLLVCLILALFIIPEARTLVGGPESTSLTDISQPQHSARSVTAIGWNGEYWLIGTFNEGCLVKLEDYKFTLVECVDSDWIHENSIEWTGKYFLAIAGVYYCDAFAYDGVKLVKLPKSSPFREVKRVTGFGENCLIVDWEYPYNYFSILAWNGTSWRVLVEDVFQLLPASRFVNFSANPFSPISVELISNGSSILVYAASRNDPSYQALFLYDGKELINLSSLLPRNYVLWQAPPAVHRQIWGDMSNGTHWLAPASTFLGDPVKPAKIVNLFLFDSRKFIEVKADPSLIDYLNGEHPPIVGWNGEYWLICAGEKILILRGNDIELSLDLSNTELQSAYPTSMSWNGEYWLISYFIPGEGSHLVGSYLVKYDGQEWVLIPPPEILNSTSRMWPLVIEMVKWGDGRWLISAREYKRGHYGRGYLFLYDGNNFKDVMRWLNEAIEEGSATIPASEPKLTGSPPKTSEEPSGGTEGQNKGKILILVLTVVLITLFIFCARRIVLGEFLNVSSRARLLVLVLISALSPLHITFLQMSNGSSPLWSYRIAGADQIWANSLSTSGDGRYLAIGVSMVNKSAEAGRVFLFNSNGTLLWSHLTDTSPEVALSQDGRYLAVGDIEGAYLFNRRGELMWNFNKIRYTRVSISSDGSYTAVGGLYSWASGWSDVACLFNRSGHLIWMFYVNDTVDDVSISSDGSYVAIACRYSLYLLSKEGELLFRFEVPRIVKPESRVPSVVSISPDGDYIALGVPEGLFFFDNEGNNLWRYGWNIFSVSISFNGSYVVAGDFQNLISFLDKNGNLLWRYGEGPVYVDISSDGRYALAGSGNRIFVYNKEGEILWSKNGSYGGPIDMSSDGRYIVTVVNYDHDAEIFFYYNKGAEMAVSTPPNVPEAPGISAYFIWVIFATIALVAILLIFRGVKYS
ncbi:MAG: hypothetical protein DRN90_03900 [Thermoproteota archaeon]|nr:MAG: hypothetical protein DRN90_03900 [Candidatus Korarchaeota archaeon]